MGNWFKIYLGDLIDCLHIECLNLIFLKYLYIFEIFKNTSSLVTNVKSRSTKQ